MKPHIIYAIIEQREPGKWNLVGLRNTDTGESYACVSSNPRWIIDDLWPHVERVSKQQYGAKIAKFMEIEDVKIPDDKN